MDEVRVWRIWIIGVIVDVTLELTENDIYTIRTEKLKTSQYESYFDQLMNHRNTAMHYARVSVAPSSFLDEMYVINYDYTEKRDYNTLLKKEQSVREITKLALDIGRHGGALEDLFWGTQKRYIASIDGKEITRKRDNAMRSESTFMEYTKPGRVEVLQEFFVPVHRFEAYINDLKNVIPANDRNDDFKVHNITIRYAAKDNYTTLNYAKEDMFGLVVLIQHGLKEEEISDATSLIQSWTNLTLEHGGTYYLPYYRYQTKEQFRSSYPEWKIFAKEKLLRDPNNVFQNMFYEYYVK